MSSKSLSFNNLPLLRVEYSINFVSPVVASLDEIYSLRQAFKEQLPNVSDFSGPSANFEFSVGGEKGVGLDNLENGLGLALRENRVFAAWQRIQPKMEYPRFAILRELIGSATKILDFSGNRKVYSITGTYSNLVPIAHGVPSELICSSLFPAFPQSDKVADFIRTVWLSEEYEFRLNVRPVEDAFLLETTVLVRKDGSLEHNLDFAHELLNQNFEAIITEKAKEIWEHEAS